VPATFEESGVRFQYPDNWKLEREDNEEGWTVLVQSPDTAFLMVCLARGHAARGGTVRDGVGGAA
jgi:hypothetical protein